MTAAIRRGLAEKIDILCEIADDEMARASDRIRAIDLLVKYGLGTGGGWHREDVIELMRELGIAVSSRVGDKDVLSALREDWLAILRKRSR